MEMATRMCLTPVCLREVQLDINMGREMTQKNGSEPLQPWCNLRLHVKSIMTEVDA